MKRTLLNALQASWNVGLPWSIDSQQVIAALLRMQDTAARETWGDWAVMDYTEELAQQVAKDLDILAYYLVARALYDPTEADEKEEEV